VRQGLKSNEEKNGNVNTLPCRSRRDRCSIANIHTKCYPTASAAKSRSVRTLRNASVKPFRLSPTIPKIRLTPACSSEATIRSAMLLIAIKFSLGCRFRFAHSNVGQSCAAQAPSPAYGASNFPKRSNKWRNVRYWPKADIPSCTAHVCF
jgi:hypothetical protein